MMPIKIIIAVTFTLILLTPDLTYSKTSTNNPSLTVLSTNDYNLQLLWKLKDLEVAKTIIHKEMYSTIYFDGCNVTSTPGKPAIPYKELVLAVPEGAEIQYSLSGIQYEYIENTTPSPVPIPGRNEEGLSVFEYISDSLDYNFEPEGLIDISEQRYFRDLPIVHVSFYPISYDHAQKRLKIIRFTARSSSVIILILKWPMK